MESYNVKFYSAKSCMETFEDRPRKVSLSDALTP